MASSGIDRKEINKKPNSVQNQSDIIIFVQITVQYRDVPPQVFISKLNRFIRENQPPRGFSAHVSWERVISEDEQELEELHFSKLDTEICTNHLAIHVTCKCRFNT